MKFIFRKRVGRAFFFKRHYSNSTEMTVEEGERGKEEERESLENKRSNIFSPKETPFILINSPSVDEERRKEAKIFAKSLFLKESKLKEAGKYFKQTVFEKSCSSLLPQQLPQLQVREGRVMGSEIAVVGRSNTGKRFF